MFSVAYLLLQKQSNWKHFHN